MIRGEAEKPPVDAPAAQDRARGSAGGRRNALVLLLALPLWACHHDAERELDNAPQENSLAELEQLPAAARNATLYRAIVDAHFPCQQVERSSVQQRLTGGTFFVASCRDSGDWAVVVDRAGTAQVTSCRAVATVGLPACRPAQSARS